MDKRAKSSATVHAPATAAARAFTSPITLGLIVLWLLLAYASALPVTGLHG